MATIMQLAAMAEDTRVNILAINAAQGAIPGQYYRATDTDEYAFGKQDGSLRWLANSDEALETTNSETISLSVVDKILSANVNLDSTAENDIVSNATGLFLDVSASNVNDTNAILTGSAPDGSTDVSLQSFLDGLSGMAQTAMQNFDVSDGITTVSIQDGKQVSYSFNNLLSGTVIDNAGNAELAIKIDETGGKAGEVIKLVDDGNGNLVPTWAEDLSGDFVGAINGITFNPTSGNVELGGALTKHTIITTTGQALDIETDGLAFSITDLLLQLRSDMGTLKMTHDSFTFKDDRTVKTGIEYVADYSATFTDNSLITKKYVDDNSLEAGQGLSLYDGKVNLGGLYTTGVEVYGTGNNFLRFAHNDTTQKSIYVSSSGVQLMGDGSFFKVSQLGAATYLDNRDIKTGIEYAADYSTTFTDNSLITKKYVDDLIGGLTYQNGITETNGVIELGGSLLKNTSINLGEFDLNFSTSSGRITSSADVDITTSNAGLILTAASGNRYRVGVAEDNNGAGYLTITGVVATV